MTPIHQGDFAAGSHPWLVRGLTLVVALGGLLFNHGFAYWIHGVMSLLAAAFVWRCVPETKGRTLEAIQDLWNVRTSPAFASQSPIPSPQQSTP